MPAGYKPGPGWPEVSTPFFHAAAAAEADAGIGQWQAQPGIRVRGYRNTGSLRPFLCDLGELLVMEPCRPDTPLRRGLPVPYDRGDYPAVLHYIAAISGDGLHLYLSGVNCRNSDGCFPRSRVALVIREIITTPDPGAAVASNLPPRPPRQEAFTPYKPPLASPILTPSLQ